jgi:ribonucleases P/MRP protein subunit RPP40
MKLDATTLNNWFAINRIKMNIKKANFILFNSQENNFNQFSIEGEPICEVKSTKYLGLILDYKLNWSDHISLVRKKMLSMYIALIKARPFINEKIAWQIYYAHIYSHLNHLNPIWSSAADSRISVLKTLQNKSIKVVKKLHWQHPTRNLYNPQILPLDVMRDFNLLLTIYRIRNGTLKSCALFEQIADMHEHFTRSSANADLYINFARTNLGQSNVFFKGLQKFNQLPLEIKTCTSISLFKQKIRSSLFSEYLLRQNQLQT